MAGTQHKIEPSARDKKLFCFGYGYTASFLSDRLRKFGWKAAGTTTDPEKKVFLKQSGVEAMIYDHNRTIMDPYQTFKDVTHVLLCIPPGADGADEIEAGDFVRFHGFGGKRVGIDAAQSDFGGAIAFGAGGLDAPAVDEIGDRAQLLVGEIGQ